MRGDDDGGRTLLRLQVTDAPAEIYLKCENLQPINSFKALWRIAGVRHTYCFRPETHFLVRACG